MSNITQQTIAHSNTDVTNINWWADIVAGLFTKGEWKTLLLTLALTYAITYALKIFYFAFINDRYHNDYQIRAMAILSGVVAAWMQWPDTAVSMEWYAAGLLIGAGSIPLYHLLIVLAQSKYVIAICPRLHIFIRGKERRMGITGYGGANRRKL